MNLRARTPLLVGYRSIGTSGNRRARTDDRSFPGINMQRVTRGVSSDSSMVGCTCTCPCVCTRTRVFRWRAAWDESEHARVRTIAPTRCICTIYIHICIRMCMYVCICMCMCAYVKILYNGILHNSLCPSRSWKEMKNEALLTAGSFSLACVRACWTRARVCPSNVLSYTHLFAFSPVQPFPYLSVFWYCYAASRECGMR